MAHKRHLRDTKMHAAESPFGERTSLAPAA